MENITRGELQPQKSLGYTIPVLGLNDIESLIIYFKSSPLKLSMPSLGTTSIESLLIYYKNVIMSTFYTCSSDN